MDKPTVRERVDVKLKKIITRDRELADIQLGELAPFIYYKKDTRDTVAQIRKAYMEWFKEEVEGLTVMGDEDLTETAEVLYNFREAMDIKGIKSVLWQQVKHQLSHTKEQLKAKLKELSPTPNEDRRREG